MSKISTIADTIISTIESELDTTSNDYHRLDDPYNLQRNSARVLDKGYGVAYGDTVNTQRLVGCNQILETTFRVFLTRRYTALESDRARKLDIEQAILEDRFTLFKKFEAESNLQGNVAKSVFISDTGIQLVPFDEQKQFIYIEMNYLATYEESLQ